tara:strand:- start:10034 stop:10942 length:909 start_codon:yes stop_codon:yes gene_type:complete
MSYIGKDPNTSSTPFTLTVQDEGSSLSTSATTLNFTGSGVTASGTGATKTINIAGGSSYANSDVDSHLNQSNPTSGYVLSWNGSDYAWVSNAGYTDSDVNTHLNQSSASSGQVLSWNGSDYSWIASGGGGGGYDWEHISDEHTGGNSIGGTGGTGNSQSTIIDISSFKNVKAKCWDYSSANSDVYGLIALVTSNSSSGSGVATEGYAQQWNWAGTMYHGSATGNTSNGFQVFGQGTSHDGNGSCNTLHLYGLDQTKVYYEANSTGMYNGIIANGAGFTTSGSSSWYLFFTGNIQAWQVAGSK